MTDIERIKEIGKYVGLSLNRLASEIGLKTPQTFYDIKKEKHRISKDLADKIKAKYSNINIGWLLTGEGEMLISESKQHNDVDIELELENKRLKGELDLKDKFIQSLEDRIKDKEETILSKEKAIQLQEKTIQAQENTIESLTKELASTKKGQTFATQRT